MLPKQYETGEQIPAFTNQNNMLSEFDDEIISEKV
jgi:hypothetical protein